jgi:hypothetical protein
MPQRPDDNGETPENSASDSPRDTKPLKPRRRPGDEIPSGEPPPATVLREASLPAGRDLSAFKAGETDQMRLVPLVPDPLPWRLILQTVHPGQSRIGLNIFQSMTIGRVDMEGDGADLDLTPHGAAELGVSRRHAALIPGTESLGIMDLESTNGTWINGRYLEPGKQHPLSAGDRIELGLLTLVVKQVTVIPRSSVP